MFQVWANRCCFGNTKRATMEDNRAHSSHAELTMFAISYILWTALYLFLFIDCQSGRATKYFIFHKHVSLLEASISLIFLVCLTQLHVMRLAALYARLVEQRSYPTDCRVSDELLMAALLQYEQSSQQYEQSSQQYKQTSQQYETSCTEEKFDELFLEASQLLDVEPHDNSMVVKPSGKQQVDVKLLNNPVVVNPSSKRRFFQPQCEKDIQAVKCHAYRRHYRHWVHGLKVFGMNGLLTDWSSRWVLKIAGSVSPFAKHSPFILAVLLTSQSTCTLDSRAVQTCLLLLLLVLLGFI